MWDMTEAYVLYELERYADTFLHSATNSTFDQRVRESAGKEYRKDKLRKQQSRARFSNV